MSKYFLFICSVCAHVVAISWSTYVHAAGTNDGGGRSTTPTTQPSNSSGHSNSGSASQTSGMGMLSTAINVGVGGMMMIPCTASPPAGPDWMACAMAAMSFGQAATDMMAKGAADDTDKGYRTGPPGGPPGANDRLPPGLPGGLTNDLGKLGINNEKGLYRFAQDQLNDLAKKGVTLNPATGMVGLPNGKSVPFSSFGSMAAMVDAGATPEQADKLLKAAAAVSDKYKVIPVGIASGGGGSGSSYAARAGSDPYADMYGLMGRRGEQPSDPKTKGLSRNLASGESIGTQTDSIFEMITRRYQQKKQENTFVAP